MARNHRKVSWMGVNGLGAVAGLHPSAGAALSVGLGTGTAIGVRMFTGLDKWSELIGGGVGVGAGMALMLSPKTRGAGFTGIVAAGISNGLRFVEAMVSDKQKIKNLTGAMSTKQDAAGVKYATQLAAVKEAAKTVGVLSGGLGIVTPQVVPTLGAVSAVTVPTLGAVAVNVMPTVGGPMGAVQAEVRQLAQPSYGQPSYAGMGAPQLPIFQGNQQPPVQIVGPGGIGRHYGATCMG